TGDSPVNVWGLRTPDTNNYVAAQPHRHPRVAFPRDRALGPSLRGAGLLRPACATTLSNAASTIAAETAALRVFRPGGTPDIARRFNGGTPGRSRRHSPVGTAEPFHSKSPKPKLALPCPTLVPPRPSV